MGSSLLQSTITVLLSPSSSLSSGGTDGSDQHEVMKMHPYSTNGKGMYKILLVFWCFPTFSIYLFIFLFLFLFFFCFLLPWLFYLP